MPEILIDLRTAEKILKGLGRQPAAPIATETPTEKGNVQHGEILPPAALLDGPNGLKTPNLKVQVLCGED